MILAINIRDLMHDKDTIICQSFFHIVSVIFMEDIFVNK